MLTWRDDLRERFHAGCHCPPGCGTLGGPHFSVDLEDFLVAAGYDPGQHPEVIAEMCQSVREEMVNAAYSVMRDHGLKPETDPRAPVHGPAPIPSTTPTHTKGGGPR